MLEGRTPRALVRGTIAALLLVAALVVAACGSDDSSDTGTAGGAKTQASSTSANGGFGLSPVASVTALVPDDVKSGGPLKNAIYNDGAPQQFLEDGRLVGIQPDFAQAVSEVMGVEFELVPVGSFDSIIPGLQGGRYDVAFADFGITAEREKIVDFVRQFDLGTSVAVKDGSGTTVETASDLCGLKLGTLAGSYFLDQAKALSEECTSAGKPAIAIQAFPTQSAAVLAVSNGRTDLYAVSSDQLAYAAKQEGSGIEAQPFVYEPIPQGIGLPKGSPLAEPIQAAMRELVANGTYAKILDKWGISNAAIPASEIAISPTPAS